MVAPAMPSRTAIIQAQRTRGGGVAVALPMHIPRPLLAAHGLLPVELWGPPGQDTTRGDVHLQSYTCSVARAGLSFALSPAAAAADLLLVPHTCDSLQGLGSLLGTLLQPGIPVEPWYVPRGEGPAVLDFAVAELRDLSARLAVHTGQRPDDTLLRACCDQDEAADERFGLLLDRLPTLGLRARTAYKFVRTREFLPPQEFIDLADALLERPAGELRAGQRLVLSGMVPEPGELFDVLEDAGAVLTGDDLGPTGRRRYPPGRFDDPWRRMAARLLEGPPDPARGVTVAERVRHLEELARRGDAHAVLFYGVKACEPELFYLPQLRAGLEAAGLRTLTVEVDITQPLPHQLVTRVEALVETLT